MSSASHLGRFLELTGVRLGIAALLPMVVAAPLSLVLTDDQAAIALMCLLLCVVTVALYLSLMPAMVAGIASFLCFNFFFTAPRFTLIIDELNDGLLAVTLLVVAVVIGLQTQQWRQRMAADARLQTELAEVTHQREQELLRSALMSSLSHDLNTPLATMIGATSTVRDLRDDLSIEQQNELLDSVIAEARRLERYVRNLLHMTRLGHGDLSLDRQDIALTELVDSVLERVRGTWPGCHLETHLPEPSPSIEVHPALIGQALFNIIDNAIKFSGNQAPVNINARFEQGDVVIDIIDQGPGIPEAEREAAFDFFNTLGRGDHHSAGEGLGLAIAKGMVGAHGGSLTILDAVSVPKGTCVRLRLPATKASTLKTRETHGQNTDH